jgi:general secretion pathway protein E
MSNRYTLEYVLDTIRQAGLIEDEDADKAQNQASSQRYRLEKEQGAIAGARGLVDITPVELLASFGFTSPLGKLLSEDRILEVIAKDSGLRFVKIDPLKLDASLITSTLPQAFARRNRLLPLERRGTQLRVATDNPFNLDAFESVRHRSNGPIEIVISAKTDIVRFLREIYGFNRALKAAEKDLTRGIDLGNLEQLFKLKSLDEIESTDKHIVNAVEYLLHHAFDQRASDIHIEPKREESHVRLRIDGVLHTVNTIPKVVHKAMVSRIKTLSRLDIAERRRPQDGRLKISRGDVEVELRVSTLPVAFGEKMVLRIFDPLILLRDLDELGFEKEQLKSWRSFIGRPNGLVLVTGPTGSGKTTTLYSSMQLLATDEVNVTTIEDPIEMVVEDFNQTSVMPKAGITFSSSVRTLLRQDPDVIMIGEIRDPETAQQAIQAALTGHLVLSTLHTNDSVTAITRLVELGIEPYLVASTLTGVLAQRLVREVCDACEFETKLSQEQMVALGLANDDEPPVEEVQVTQGRGCPQCRYTGLRGRRGVYEILPISVATQKLIMDGANAKDLMDHARATGMQTLRESAVRKLLDGVTSFEEVLRLTVD